MPRTARASQGAYCYHVINRGNARAEVFHKRAELVERAQEWPWSSISSDSQAKPMGLISEGPVVKPSGWNALVNRAESEAELQRLRHSVNRGTPYGSEPRATATAVALGLESSLRPRGRPRKK